MPVNLTKPALSTNPAEPDVWGAVLNANATAIEAAVAGLDAAVASKIDAAQKGAANGLAALDATGKVPAAQLPASSGTPTTDASQLTTGTLDPARIAAGSLPESKLSADVQSKLNSVASGGIPSRLAGSQFEHSNFYCYGHSFTSGTGGLTEGEQWPYRVATRLRALPLVSGANHFGQPGTGMQQFARRALATWNVANRGTVLLQLFQNEGPANNSAAMTTNALRALLTILSAKAKIEQSASAFAFSPGWAAGPTADVSGGTSQRTTTLGSYVDIAFNGDKAAILVQGEGATGGVATVTRSGDGATVATVDTNGNTSGAVTGNTPMVIPLTGFGAGDHTVRLTLTSGTGLTVDGLLIPKDAATAPRLLVLLEEPTTAGAVSYASRLPAARAVFAEFPNVTLVEQGFPDTEWSHLTHQFDGLHPNDRGARYYADRGVAALLTAEPTFRDGMNYLTQSPFAYTSPTPNYVASATVPAQVTGLTATPGSSQVALAWTPPSNGGSAITDYVIQQRTGGGSFTTITDGTSTAASYIVTGLTNGTAYDFQVAAVNSVGQGPYSAIATATPTAAPTAPGAPVIGTATAGDGTATVPFTAPASNGGSAITGYTATSSPGGVTGTATSSPITVSGLTNGTAYTFTVTATNAVGTGPASAASNSVTPTAAASGSGFGEGPFGQTPFGG